MENQEIDRELLHDVNVVTGQIHKITSELDTSLNNNLYNILQVAPTRELHELDAELYNEDLFLELKRI